MILARKVISTSHWQNYGCFTPNIAKLSGLSDAEQEAYLELVKSAFPNLRGAVPWIRESRYGIDVTAGYPNWNTDVTRYWPNMYYRPAVSDFMSGRYVMFEPLLWVRQSASTPVMCTPNVGPNYFGRNAAGVQVVDDSANTWRNDIRRNLDRLMASDVGTLGGEPYVTRAKYTNYRNLMILGPHEIDKWVNARLYYVADEEVSVATSGLPIYGDYNIDVRQSGNILTRAQQEGHSGSALGWATVGAGVNYQADNTVSQGDGVRVSFASSAGSYVITAGDAMPIGGTPATLTFSAYMRAVGAASLTSVYLQIDWKSSAVGGYISSSNQTFTVSNTGMTQYSFTATRPGAATHVSAIISRAATGGGVLDVDFVVIRSSATMPVPSSTSQANTGVWTKVFEDEFDTFNTANWTKAVAFNWTDVYGVETWNDSLVTVANSKLRITAQLINGVWNSGLILSKTKKEYTYGYFEAHMKLSAGIGMWPAWWMMPVTATYGAWPRSGEIDIMENPGGVEVMSAGGTINYWSGTALVRKSVLVAGTDWSAGFHTWGVLWEKSADNRVIVRFFVDNIPYGMFDQSEWPAAPGGTAGSPFDHAYFMILNLAVGGPWSGSPVSASSGSFIEIDWVKVWRRVPNVPILAPSTGIVRLIGNAASMGGNRVLAPSSGVVTARGNTATLAGASIFFVETFNSGYTINTNWNEGATVGNWYVNFLGSGYARVVNAASPRLELCPGDIDVVGGTTLSTLVTTTASYSGDIQVAVDMLLIAQLRSTAPNAWESPWLLWNCTSAGGVPTGSNYLAFKTNGWELGLILGGDAQAFISTGSTPVVSNAFQNVRVHQLGTTVDVFINGVRLDLASTGSGSSKTDSRFYTSGNVGLYTEDAQVQFDNLEISNIFPFAPFVGFVRVTGLVPGIVKPLAPPSTGVVRTTGLAPAVGFATPEIPFSADFFVSVGGVQRQVHTAKIGIEYQYDPINSSDTSPVGFTNVDITGATSAVVDVKNRTVATAKILPSSRAITPTVTGNRVTFAMPDYGTYELVINNDVSKSLYIFANPPETNIPVPGAGVIIYGPGVHNPGPIDIPINTTVYLAPGAIVYGAFWLPGSNITIRGRGILCGSKIALHDEQLIVLSFCSNVLIEGITMIDSPGWNVHFNRCDGVVIDRIKQFSYRQNSDGIDVKSSINVEIKNVFIRNWDDGITMKGWDGYGVDNAWVHDCVIETDYGTAALEVGQEIVAPSVGNITFENIDIVHSHAGNAIDVGSGDLGTMHHITFSNIRIEDHIGLPGYLEYWITLFLHEADVWSSPGGPGQMNNITFNNVSVVSGPVLATRVRGFDASHVINTVTFNNLRVLGVHVTSAAQINMQVSFATNVTFT